MCSAKYISGDWGGWSPHCSSECEGRLLRRRRFPSPSALACSPMQPLSTAAAAAAAATSVKTNISGASLLVGGPVRPRRVSAKSVCADGEPSSWSDVSMGFETRGRLGRRRHHRPHRCLIGSPAVPSARPPSMPPPCRVASTPTFATASTCDASSKVQGISTALSLLDNDCYRAPLDIMAFSERLLPLTLTISHDSAAAADSESASASPLSSSRARAASRASL